MLVLGRHPKSILLDLRELVHCSSTGTWNNRSFNRPSNKVGERMNVWLEIWGPIFFLVIGLFLWFAILGFFAIFGWVLVHFCSCHTPKRKVYCFFPSCFSAIQSGICFPRYMGGIAIQYFEEKTCSSSRLSIGSGTMSPALSGQLQRLKACGPIVGSNGDYSQPSVPPNCTTCVNIT